MDAATFLKCLNDDPPLRGMKWRGLPDQYLIDNLQLDSRRQSEVQETDEWRATIRKKFIATIDEARATSGADSRQRRRRTRVMRYHAVMTDQTPQMKSGSIAHSQLKSLDFDQRANLNYKNTPFFTYLKARVSSDQIFLSLSTY